MTDRALTSRPARGPSWHATTGPGKRKTLNTFLHDDFVPERVEKTKASIRAKVEHPFRVIKRQFGFTKARYRGLAKNTAQIAAAQRGEEHERLLSAADLADAFWPSREGHLLVVRVGKPTHCCREHQGRRRVIDPPLGDLNRTHHTDPQLPVDLHA